jgi:hypothetical protein
VVILDKGLHPLDERYVDEYALRDQAGAGVQGVQVTLRCPLCLGVLVQTHRQRRAPVRLGLGPLSAGDLELSA